MSGYNSDHQRNIDAMAEPDTGDGIDREALIQRLRENEEFRAEAISNGPYDALLTAFDKVNPDAVWEAVRGLIDGHGDLGSKDDADLIAYAALFGVKP